MNRFLHGAAIFLLHFFVVTCLGVLFAVYPLSALYISIGVVIAAAFMKGRSDR